MSNIKMRHNWYKNDYKLVVFTDNQELSAALVEQLKEHYQHNVSKHVAHTLNMNLYHVRNWFNKKTGLKAFDLLILLENYQFIRDFLGFDKRIINNRITGKKNRMEIRKKILSLVSENPQMTLKDLALTLEITPKSAEWHLYQLVKEKKVKRIGATKNGKWLVRK